MSDDRRTLLLQALQAVEEMKQKLHASESAAAEPLAIIGMGCRFPGGASTPDAYWSLLHGGIDAVREIPSARWGARGVPPGDAIWKAGLVDGLEDFDPRFFDMSAREALTLDPQQRMVLEVAWEALEYAGINPQRLKGSATGVFIGITGHDYGQLVRDSGRILLDVYAATGSASNAAAGRLSFVLGLQGPSVAVDTACSSSLTAVHLACQSLRTRESRIAIAGGVNAVLTPDPFICFANWGMMAPDGRCKAFDAAADGFVRSEGCGMVVLKRLSDALADGDNILALIRGSAVNQDGRSSGLTVPNGPAQEAVIRQALAAARIQPSDIDYVEAHGTGTSLGDPIEAHAIATVLGAGRDASHPLTVGSVKTNIGHLESAAGIAGLIKVVLSLQHGRIPPHLHFRRMNPQVDWLGVPVEIPVTGKDWKTGIKSRFAGVSSFGFSGTNAHVILEEAPTHQERKATTSERGVYLLALSARSESAQTTLAERYAAQLADSGANLGDLCSTATAGRAAFSERAVYLAATREELQTKLLRGSCLRGRARRESSRIAFLFSGQGSQYANMGRELYETEPVFRRAIETCAAALKGELDPGLMDVLYGGSTGLLNDTRYTQPALFAVEYALAHLWRSWGVEPAVVLGHSVGEYAAACIAGFCSLEDAIRLIAARARLMGDLPKGEGAMAAILAPEDEIVAAVAPHSHAVSVASLNASHNVVISGRAAEVEQIAASFAARGVRVEQLRVSHAFHSPLMAPIEQEFARRASQLEFRAPRMALISSVTGQAAKLVELQDSSYWRRQVREPVRFRKAMETLAAQGCDVFVEIGPGSTLLGMGKACIGGDDHLWTPSIRRTKGDNQQIAESVAALFVRGVAIDWDSYEAGRGRKRIPLPTYPFERQRYWIGDLPLQTRAALPSTGHPLLGERVDLADQPHVRVWQSRIALSSVPWIADHRVQGRAVLPATAYVEMAAAAARETFGDRAVSVTGFEFRRPVFFTDASQPRFQVTLTPCADETSKVSIYSKDADGNAAWVLNATAQCRPALLSEADGQPHINALEQCREVPRVDFYARLAELGNDFGPSFQLVSRARIGESSFVSDVEIPEDLVDATNRYHFHPTLADACGHGLSAIGAFAASNEGAGAIVGEGIGEVCIFRKPQSRQIVCRGYITRTSDPSLVLGNATVEDQDGTLLASVSGVRLRYLQAGASPAATGPNDWFYRVDWEEFVSTGISEDRTWIITGEARGLANELSAALQASGLETVVCESAGDATAALASLEPSQPAAIVYTGGLNAHVPAVGESPGEATGCSGLLRLMKSVLESNELRDVRVYVLTKGAQSVAGSHEPEALWQSPLWGFGRIVAVEHHAAWGGLVDLDPQAGDAANAELLCGLLNLSGSDDQFAIRGGRLLCPRLEHTRVLEQSSPKFRADSAYLITGGLGGLGLATARWMSEHGARRLILVSRTALPDRASWAELGPEHPAAQAAAAIQQIESFGVVVETAAFDVADDAALRAFLDQRKQASAPTIRGVMHTAGVMLHEPLMRTTAEALDSVLRPKIAAWNLCRQLDDQPLDFFMPFSSAAAIHGTPGQAGYAAANAFLDFLPHARADAKLRSVSWGLWTETGMAVRSDGAAVRMHLERGLGGMTTQQGMDALAWAMGMSEPSVAVIPVNWKNWAALYPAHVGAPILSRIMANVEASDSFTPAHFAITPDAANALDLAQRLSDSDPEDRPEIMRAFVREQVAYVLGFDEVHKRDDDRGLTELGLDSLMAVELSNRLGKAMGRKLPATTAFERPTVMALAGYLDDLLAAQRGVTTVAPSSAIEEQLDEESSEALERALSEELNRAGY